MPEAFRPISNTPPDSPLGKLKFRGRMLLDLQILTIYRDLKATLPSFTGDVLDVGCGQSAYKHMLGKGCRYFGIDIVAADQFDYKNPDITPFNGENIPFGNEKFDGLICTEVLEHVQNFQKLVDEMHRVMRNGARGIITIPWSARYHYIPFDFFRYTPSSLKNMFKNFSEVQVKPRGSDITSISGKVIVLWFRHLFPSKLLMWMFLPFWVLLLPVLAFVVLIAHLSLYLHLGSEDDPLGYTILVTK